MKLKKLLYEGRSEIDSDHLIGVLTDLSKEAKRNKERDLSKFYDVLGSELEKSYPDQDVDRKIIEKIIYSHNMKKLTSKVPEWIVDSIFEN